MISVLIDKTQGEKMKKLLAVLLAVTMLITLGACTKEEEPTVDPEPETTDDVVVMSYDEYCAAEIGAEVTIEGYVQATQSYYNGATLYLADGDHGAYFIYNGSISEEDFAKLGVSTEYGEGWTGVCNSGVKVRVTGYKSEYAGEIEIADTTEVTVIEGEGMYAFPDDVTALVGTDELADHMNECVEFTSMTIVAQDDGNAFNYKSSAGDDLYFAAEDANGNRVDFCVESYLTYDGSDVYEYVENELQVGDVVDITGFLYWYNGANPHVISVAAAE